MKKVTPNFFFFPTHSFRGEKGRVSGLIVLHRETLPPTPNELFHRVTNHFHQLLRPISLTLRAIYPPKNHFQSARRGNKTQNFRKFSTAMLDSGCEAYDIKEKTRRAASRTKSTAINPNQNALVLNLSLFQSAHKFKNLTIIFLFVLVIRLPRP